MNQLPEQITPALNEANRAVEDKAYDQIIMTVKSIQNASNSRLIILKKNIDTIITVCSLNSTQQQQKSLLLSWVDPSTKKKQIK